MGARQSSTIPPEDDSVHDRLATHPSIVLKQCKVEHALLPGSGRILKTFRIRHTTTEAVAVMKTGWILVDEKHHEPWLQTQIHELKRIREALEGQLHVTPMHQWIVDPPRTFRNGTTWRAVYLFRPHLYTTLQDRIVSRPWMHVAEKLFASLQLLRALHALHTAGVVHGFVTTENCGWTAAGWLTLMDLAHYKTTVHLPDDDPSEFVYYFQPNTEGIRRCYLAPERFGSGGGTDDIGPPPITPAVDIFAAGCVLTELFSNGEPCLALGDLLEWKKDSKQVPVMLQQRLSKLERPAIRACVKHMLAVDPAERLSAAEYLERLRVAEPFPECFNTLYQLLEQIQTVLAPDARLVLAAKQYYNVIWETVGVSDEPTQMQIQRMLGLEEITPSKPESGASGVATKDPNDLLAETEALLAQLDSLQLDTDEEVWKNPATNINTGRSGEERSDLSKNSLLIYLQIIASTVRHVQRPVTKLVALQLIHRLADNLSDEARLQRIVPVVVSLLQDSDALVRALSVQVLTYTLSIVRSFPPSDAQIFPQYIFKRVAHLISDPSLVARLAFARSIGVLAETAQRFLDITHAVRLYEAVGSGSKPLSAAAMAEDTPDEKDRIFGDDVHRLLDATARSESRASLTDTADTSMDSRKSETGRALIRSTYSSDLAVLQETISRWVVHMATDQSNHSSLSKRALLEDLGRLCIFFGMEGVMSFILPQILAFLNERKDWHLRASLFVVLPSVCFIIGKAATEEFVLPCVEIGLVDGEEHVISRAIDCLTNLVRLRLLSRLSIVGNTSDSVTSGFSLIKKYAVLLLHPSEEIRTSARNAFASMCKFIEPVDIEVHVVPALAPFLRYRPRPKALVSEVGFAACIDSPWTREKFEAEKLHVVASTKGFSHTSGGGWTTVGISISDDVRNPTAESVVAASIGPEKEKSPIDPQTAHFRGYLVMLMRHTAALSPQDRPLSDSQTIGLATGIEGSVKLAQSVMFPKQNGRAQKGVIPHWYNTLRSEIEAKDVKVSEDSCIRSVSALGDVFGLSIMGPTSEAIDDVAGDSNDSDRTSECAKDVLSTQTSKNMEEAFSGKLFAETMIDPEMVDTCLLLTKLKAMKVPPLPPQLGRTPDGESSQIQLLQSRTSPSVKNWKPKINALMASSAKTNGHSAPVTRLAVSIDQSFFVSGSQDGYCIIWPIAQVEDSSGILESTVKYAGHSTQTATRVNDIAMIEGSHSIVSGASDGSVHVWRVELIENSRSTSSLRDAKNEAARIVGTTSVKKVDRREGEIMGVSHFNSLCSSVATFATQKGVIHAWDLRSPHETFSLQHSPCLGNLTSFALGSDRNWIVSGSSKGYLVLWDIRYQQPLKLWRHSRGTQISRLATSYLLPSEPSASPDSFTGARPLLFVASGPNECGMFDLMDGLCRSCFRTIDGGIGGFGGHVENLPGLVPMPFSFRNSKCTLRSLINNDWPVSVPLSGSVNCMVGSVGGGDQSYLITGGGDGLIKFWDFMSPSKCFVVSGLASSQNRPLYERIDFDENRGLLLCRHPTLRDDKTKAQSQFRGLKKPEHYHTDAIQDLKLIDNALISCSRDCSVKIWR